MKPLLIRLSALATIVALGLIAIAQAQRSGKDDSSLPEVVAKTPSDDTQDRSDPVRQGISSTSSVSGSSGSGLFGGFSGNPLRGSHGEQSDSTQDFSTVEFSGSGGPAYQGEQYPSSPEGVEYSRPTNNAHLAESAYPVRDRDHSLPETPAGAVNSQSTSDTETASTVPNITTGAPLFPPARTMAPPPKRAPAPAWPDNSEEPIDSRAGDQNDQPKSVPEPARLPFDPEVPIHSLSRPANHIAAPSHHIADPIRPGSQSAVREAVSLVSEGVGTPGNQQLEGPQAPQLTIQKFAPAEIQVGKATTFRVQVTNTGRSAARGVEVHDTVPRGTRLLGTNPRTSRAADGQLAWELGTLQPGDEVSIEIELMPTEEGEVGSVATVRMNADASCRTIATKPELAIHTAAPDQVLIGEEMMLLITVSNPGSGIATGVVIEEYVPPGFQHADGAKLECLVGDLAPNESYELPLSLVATQPGRMTNVLLARGDANLKIEDRLDIDVVAPQLEVSMSGPTRRYLEREATYTLAISNPGTAPARNVALVAELPVGFEFVSANNAGQYQAASRTVHWSLDELPASETGSVRLTAIPMEAGEKTVRFTSTAEPGLSVEGTKAIAVEGIAAILFQVADVQDPIELGGETTYEIRVTNQGSKAATNIQLEAEIPPQMKAVSAEGPSRHSLNNSRVVFEGLPRLAPKADVTYRVRVQGLQPGDLRLRVRVMTDEMTTPVTKEESTRVYSDE